MRRDEAISSKATTAEQRDSVAQSERHRPGRVENPSAEPTPLLRGTAPSVATSPDPGLCSAMPDSRGTMPSPPQDGADSGGSSNIRQPAEDTCGLLPPPDVLARVEAERIAEAHALAREIAERLEGCPIEYLSEELCMAPHKFESLLRGNPDGFTVEYLRGIAKHYRGQAGLRVPRYGHGDRGDVAPAP